MDHDIQIFRGQVAISRKVTVLVVLAGNERKAKGIRRPCAVRAVRVFPTGLASPPAMKRYQ